MYEDEMKKRGQERKKRVNVPNFKNETASGEEKINSNSYVRQYENEIPDDEIFISGQRRRSNIYSQENYNSYNGYNQNNSEYDLYEERPVRKSSNQTKGTASSTRRKGMTKEQKKKRLRRRRIRSRICWCMLILIGAIGGHMVGKLHAEVNQVLNKINRSSVTDLSSVKVNEGQLQKDKSIINILLIGSDKRADWSEAGRSDSTMIGTLDMKNKRLKITSLMRDMYITIPEHGENKFNAAYSYGGVPLLYQTIAQNFDLKIDAYVVVDFDAFVKVINTIGGVKIELTDAEQEYLTTAYKKGSVLKLKKGVNNMNGAQALAYCRIRQDSKGDFGRTERQRKVIQSIFNKAKKMSYSQLVDLAGELMPYISTDLTNDEILSYMTSIIMLGTTEIDQMRIPIDQSYKNTRIGTKAVLIPDLELNKQALQEFIFQYNGN